LLVKVGLAGMAYDGATSLVNSAQQFYDGHVGPDLKALGSMAGDRAAYLASPAISVAKQAYRYFTSPEYRARPADISTINSSGVQQATKQTTLHRPYRETNLPSRGITNPMPQRTYVDAEATAPGMYKAQQVTIPRENTATATPPRKRR